MKNDNPSELLKSLNKELLALFKDHIEWETYKDNAVYPFWNSLKNKNIVNETDEFDKWADDLKKELMNRGKTKKVTPTYDFDASGVSYTKNDFSKLSNKTYLESGVEAMCAIIDNIEGDYDSKQYTSSIDSLVECLQHMDKNDPRAQALINEIKSQLSAWTNKFN